MERYSLCLVGILLVSVCWGTPIKEDDDSWMHPHDGAEDRPRHNSVEDDASYWQNVGRENVMKAIKRKFNFVSAKNVIMFLGDGMSLTTVAAARIYKGQLNGATGEEEQLSFEKFPATGLSKTYCVDRQVADSACSATAYLCGVKANYGTIGVSAKVERYNCDHMQNTSDHVHSLAKLFNDDGRSAGIVTTTRVTHASPAGAYAHTASRDWESDTDLKDEGLDVTKCRDIAHQLIYGDPGKDFKVILGGGRREFRPKSVSDEEGTKGKRSDGRDLIKEWQDIRANDKQKYEYVWNRDQLMNMSNNTDYLLGLFEGDHCRYHLEGNPKTEPTFEEMVEKAINVLSKNEKGFFLFAEGGRIDHGHHGTYARLALDETVEFSKGIAKAVSMTDPEDTLIVVTSDHAHVMTMNGYPSRGNNILGANNKNKASDGLKYLTLSYANGPGYRKEVDGKRVDVTKENMEKVRFQYPSMVPLSSETHGGEDVGIFANGPLSMLFSGVWEQNVIPHLISFISCLTQGENACNWSP